MASEKEALSEIMLEHGIEWDKKGTHEKHRTVSAYKRDEMAKEVCIFRLRSHICTVF